ncbi:MAG: HAMP domain-containing histidine kinase, partial [Nitrospinae bacterium]|nr:HAMP domain-containing histidine kinase [Nitrospinota bacterium]
VLAVCDNGEGLSGEDVRKIFDPFYGINNLRKSTGMGLAVTREIVEDHNGEISINSTKGKGTEVTVRLGLV